MRHYPYFFGIAASVILVSYAITNAAFAAVTIDFVEPGSPAAADEYISVVNNGDSAVDISKWSLQIRSDTATTFQKKNFSPGMQLDPHSTFIIANKDGRFALQSQMTYSSLSLSGDGGTAALVATTTYLSSFDDATIVSKYHFGGKTSAQTMAAPVAALTQSMQSQPDLIQTIPSKKSWPIELSEIFPHPQTDDEFIELYNNSNDAVDVSGLLLRDASGNSYALGAHSESTFLGSYERRAWPRATTHIALNDTDGELIQLIDQFGTIIDSIIYSGDAPLNTAYAKLRNVWLWTLNPTPSAANRYTAVPSPPIARALIPQGPFKILQSFSVSAADTTDPDGDITSLAWNFGDGETAMGAIATHAYTNTGSFNISFIATDSHGATSTVARTVQVTLPNIVTEKTSGATSSTVAGVLIASAQADPPTKKSPPRITKSSAHIFTGVISVPLGILPSHQIGVNERTVEVNTKNNALTELTRGTVIEFTATEQIKQDKPILMIDKNSYIKILGSSTAAEPITFSGQIANIETWGFTLVTTSSEYGVVVKSKLINGKRASVGDTVEITGVLLHDSPQHETLVPLRSQDIRAAASTKNSSMPSNMSSYILLICTAIIFVALHVFLTYYSKHHDSWSWKKLWARLRIIKIWPTT